MISWEHLRFLALLIPTWLLLGAVAVTFTMASKSAAAPSSEASATHATAVNCKD
jgi:hypothetical protein